MTGPTPAPPPAADSPSRPRKPRLRKTLPWTGSILGVALIALAASSWLRRPATETVAPTAAPPAVPLPPAKPEPERIAVRPGATFAEIFQGLGFDPAAVHDLRTQVKPVYDLGRIDAGHELRVLREGDRLRSLEYDVDDDRYLAVASSPDGRYAAELRAYPYETRGALLRATIDETLVGAIDRAGESPQLSDAVAEIMAWDIDFHTDPQPGDVVRVLYEKKFLDGRFRRYGRVLAVEYVNEGKPYRAFRFSYPDGKTDYFDEAGKSLRKEFLKSPLPYGTRVTSRFSFSRLHPIRRVYRAHLGVDYGAPVGFPVRATGDGAVVSAGWNGGAGRMVHLRHNGGYETMYLHLSRIAAGVRPGARVSANQVIGAVGSSGESTGPHLDYRIRQRGKFINPLSARFDPAEPLRKEYAKAFEAEMTRLRATMEMPWMFVRAVLPPR